MNRDTDLVKIRVYASYCHSEFRSRVSYVFGAVLSVYVTFMGLFLQKTIEPLTYYLALFMSAPIFIIRARAPNVGRIVNSAA